MDDQSPTRTVSDAPAVWVITEGRIGDDNQLIALADALGWPYLCWGLRNNLAQVVVDRICDAAGLKLGPAMLVPSGLTWPQIVMATGGRSVSLARRIKAASGGRTQLVFLGRPWAPLDLFDLVVTTPQYRLPERPNVVQNLLPLNAVAPERLAAAQARWAPRFAHLPRPWTAILAGGDSGSFRFTADCARRLAERGNAVARATGGSLLISTSGRTPPAAVEALAAAIDVPAHLYRWHRDDPDNPHQGLLALADSFIVTGESASLIAEAVNTCRPVELFALRQRALSRLLTGPLLTRRDGRFRLGFLDRLVAGGWLVPARDLLRLHRALDAEQLLSAANAPAVPPIQQDLTRAMRRIHALPLATAVDRAPVLGVMEEATA